jgi:quercetin dioxygenase-like cupin family protein
MLAVAFLLLALVRGSASAEDKASVVPIAKTKFASLEGLPKCLTLSPQRDDPSKGPAVIRIKMPAGCKVPWRWHTVAGSLLFVSGKGKLEMRDAAAENLSAGEYVYLPGKQQHEFTCIAQPAGALKSSGKAAAAGGKKQKEIACFVARGSLSAAPDPSVAGEDF